MQQIQYIFVNYSIIIIMEMQTFEYYKCCQPEIVGCKQIIILEGLQT